jgi:hypothetical protein
MSGVTYCRINLSKTNYDLVNESRFIAYPNFRQLDDLYTKYCKHKQFKSVIPLFREQFNMPNTDLIGYYDNDQLVAYSLVLKYNESKSVVAERFVWNYANPKLRLGIRSLEHECALYKQLNYEYLYLGEYVEYKSNIDGFELLGPR